MNNTELPLNKRQYCVCVFVCVMYEIVEGKTLMVKWLKCLNSILKIYLI